MKKWIIFAILTAIAGAASAVLPYVADLANGASMLAASSTNSRSTAGMIFAALGIMAVIVVRRSGK